MHSQVDRIVTSRYSGFLFFSQFFIFSLLGVLVQISEHSQSFWRASTDWRDSQSLESVSKLARNHSAISSTAYRTSRSRFSTLGSSRARTGSPYSRFEVSPPSSISLKSSLYLSSGFEPRSLEGRRERFGRRLSHPSSIMRCTGQIIC